VLATKKVKQMKKILTVLLLGITTIAGSLEAAWNPTTQSYDPEWKVDFVPYAGYLNYHNNTSKDTATVYGMYEYIGYGLTHLMELSQDYTDITQKNTEDHKQWDFSAVYTNFSIPKWKIKLGGHYMENNDIASNHTWTGIAGLHYIGSYNYDAGTDVFLTKYRARSPTLWVYQASPHVGFNFMRDTHSSWRNDITGNWIYHSEAVGLADRHFYSIEDNLHYYWNKWTFGGNGWLGKKSYAVGSGGFAVYNLAEEYTGGYGMDVKYVINYYSSLTLKYSRTQFKEISTESKTKVDNFILTFGYSF
jgi:hypothetical protein